MPEPRVAETFQRVAAYVVEGIGIIDASGRFTYLSDAITRHLGYSADDLVGRTAVEIHEELGLFEADELERWLGALEEAMAQPELSIWHEVAVRASDRSRHVLRARITNRFEDPGVGGLMINVLDVTSEADARDAIQASERRFRVLVENSSEGIVVISADLEHIYHSPGADLLVGMPVEEAFSDGAQKALDTIHPDDRQRVRESTESLIGQPGASATDRFRVAIPGGGWRWVERRITNHLGDPAIGGLVVNIRDVTKQVTFETQQQALIELAETALSGLDLDRMLRDIVEEVAGGLGAERVVVTKLDPASRVQRVWASSGWPAEELADLEFGPDSLAGFCLRSPEPVVAGDLQDDNRFTEPAAVLAAGLRAGLAATIPGADGPVGCLVAHQRDRNTFAEDEVRFARTVASLLAGAIERRRSAGALEERALHDLLTGLPNRALLLDRIHHALERSAESATGVAVLLLDLDDFKMVNETMGHQTGDQLLRAVARRLAEQVDHAGSLARLGGDEFVLLYPELSDVQEAMDLAEQVRGALQEPFLTDEAEVTTTASIGIAVGRLPDAGAETLLADADAAMYRAKEQGRDRVEIFDEQMRPQMLERLQLQNALRRAIDHGELRAFYQPIIRLDDGAIVGIEALIRWEHPERGLLAPGAFLEVAERTGLVVPMGEWMLEQACRQAVAWQARSRRPLTVSVNLAADQLQKSDLVGVVRRVLAATGLEARQLELEITESVLIHSTERALETLWELRDLGVAIALDDFGTGFSSLSYVKQFPIDHLKIDRSFVDGLGESGDDTAIVEAVLALGHSLGLRTVAEGVETDRHLVHLRTRKCDYAQGYFFSPPRPPEEIESLLVEDRRW